MAGFYVARYAPALRSETDSNVQSDGKLQPSKGDRRWAVHEIRAMRDDLDGKIIKVEGVLYRDKGSSYWLLDRRVDQMSLMYDDAWQEQYGLRLPAWRYRDQGGRAWLGECTLEGKFGTLDMNGQFPADCLSPLFSASWDDD
ncbi:MAG: hypothetical protein EOP83_05880 [Verrucomicrobiaceae bacterium]|nr:MAG: hypothetical protein EOP83_05880 [Verrucomicrobiaceae bacterium]